jgi:hypothetical protein
MLVLFLHTTYVEKKVFPPDFRSMGRFPATDRFFNNTQCYCHYYHSFCQLLLYSMEDKQQQGQQGQQQQQR